MKRLLPIFLPALSLFASVSFAQQPALDGATDPATFQLPPDFKAELVYSVPKDQQGSWVAITTDPRGRIIAANQTGGLFRVTPPGGGKPVNVEPIKTGTVGAHGLLYAFDSLYVMVNEQGERGIWRLKDTNGDDQFDEEKLILKINHSMSEHGVHGLALSPDGKSIYFANGNHTQLPEGTGIKRPLAYSEDHVVPRLWDANGHAANVMAPGGYIGKVDPDGKNVELFCIGFRNQYDIAFDQNGELFTFDSDMEWDIGSPWYMPTRINHCVSGADYGWRSGAGRWPAYYADSLPAVVDIGPSSPVGVTFGTQAKFPAKYQRAFFACDWTYGTMYAVHLKPDGASYLGDKEEFIAGKPLPFTDVLIHPDGSMYFSIGGRGVKSALYRVVYTGKENTAPIGIPPVTQEVKLRRDLEKFHVAAASPDVVGKVWPYLGNKDRFIRFAARVALEHQPVASWADKALAEKNPQVAIEALIALARMGDKALQPKLIAALLKFDFAKLPGDLPLPILRAWQLTITRMGKPSPEACETIISKLDPVFPSSDPFINRELVGLLVALDSPTIVAKTVSTLDTAKDAGISVGNEKLLARNTEFGGQTRSADASRPNRQAIAYAYALRNAKVGWTPEMQKTFFGWFPRTASWSGGNSFKKFLQNIRKDALANTVSDDAIRATMDALSQKAPEAAPSNIVLPKGPGKAYTVEDVVALAKGGLNDRNFEQGKAMYTATLCSKCHLFAGEGGNIGPDITGAGSRYSLRDLMENIIDPSKVINEQYVSTQIEKKDGNIVVGLVTMDENEKLFVMSSPLAPEEVTVVDKHDVKSRKPFNVSMMPPGLINSLNEDELLNLVAYILSAGNKNDKAFKK